LVLKRGHSNLVRLMPMYEGLSTREIVGWVACLIVAAGLIVLGAVYLVNADLTADVSQPHNAAGSAKARAVP